jgi:hypothetical protein
MMGGAPTAPMPEWPEWWRNNAAPKRPARSRVPFVLARRPSGPSSARVVMLVIGGSLALWCVITAALWLAMGWVGLR